MSRLRSAGAFVLLSAVWGTAFTVIKIGLEYLPPVLFAAIRYDVAAVFMLGYAAVRADHWRPRSYRDWLAILTGGVFVIGLYNAFLFLGQQGVSSGVAAIIVATNPILATVFSRGLLPSNRLRPIGVVGLALGFLGVGLVARPDPGALLGDGFLYPGLVLLAAVAVALGSVLIEWLDAGIGTVGIVAWSTVIGAVVLHVISAGLYREPLSGLEFTPMAILAVAYLGIVASAFGYAIYFSLLARVGAIEINLVSYAAPAFAATAGWLLLGETLDILAVAGFAAIFAGFVLVKRRALRAELETLAASL
ncbi:MAG: DMT family transporter [Salinirussus sp.]